MNTPTGKLRQYLTTAFDPRQFPNCALWFDAADSNTITTSGGYVTQWNDKSGNSRNASNVGTGVVSGGTTLNGLNTINFASGSYLLTSSFTMDTITRTAFVAYKFTSNAYPADGNYYDQFFLRGNTAASNSFQCGLLRDPSPFPWRGHFGISSVGYFPLGGTFYTGASGPTNTAAILTVQRSAAQTGIVSYTGSNSTATFTNSTAFQASEALRIGDTMSNTQIAEIIYYNSALTSNQIQAIEGYLAAKWGLTSSVPATHPYKSLPPISRQFAPVDISGCVLWIDAADATTVTLSGNNITQLQDKSSNAYVFATASGFTYDVVKFNTSYPSFYSPTSTAGYSLGSNASFTLNQPFTAFAVGGNLISPGSGGYFWDSTSNGNRAALLSFNPGRPTMFAGVELFSTNSNSFTGALILTCRYNSTSSSIFENGSNVSSNTNVGTQNAVSLRLGAAWPNSTNWNGHICEILFFNRLVSTAEQQQIEGYLANKWGLRGNLASTHPFKLYDVLTPAFTPVQISNCQLWLDAADESKLTLSAGNVTQWTDKSSNGFVFSNAGTVTTSTMNGLNCLAMTAGNRMTRASFSWNNYFTIFCIAAGSNGFLVSTWTGSFYRFIVHSANGPLLMTEGTNYFRDNTTAPYSSNPYMLVIGYNGGTSVAPYTYNGTARTATLYTGGPAGNNTWTDPIFINGNGTTSGFGSNNVGEVIHYNRSLTYAEHVQVEGYLAHKWGLVGSLPASHPYKKFRN